MEVALEPVTRLNVRALCELRLGAGQKRLVAPAAFTIAEGHYEPGALLPVPGGAEEFWRRCGFRDTGRRSHEGEPILSRRLVS
jgi:hypothetical protein